MFEAQKIHTYLVDVDVRAASIKLKMDGQVGAGLLESKFD